VRLLAALLLLAPAGQEPAHRDPASIIGRARAEAARGELPSARESWLAASALLPAGPDRDDCVARAREIDMRLAVRREIAAGFQADERLFAEIGVTRADAEGLVLHGQRIAWSAAPLETLRRSSAICRASTRACAGLVLEHLARGTPEEREEALRELGAMLEKRRIDAPEAWSIVAHHRGERVPSQGYLFREGGWREAQAVAAEAVAAGIEELGRRLETAPAAQRESALAGLLALGPEGEARAGAALRARFDSACAALRKGATLAQLAVLATEHAELERRRQAALDLIFDTEQYFYPYAPPECPPEKARLYAGVQQRVDSLVSAVRETWKAGRRVKPPAAFRAALEELDWLRAQRVDAALPEGLPTWTEGLDPALDTLDLGGFALDRRGRELLARDRAVAVLNERAFRRKDLEQPQVPGAEEQEQVRLTNEYRRMLGRRVLAWNTRIQAAAQGHADYMANTGDFGHFEKDPARRTPADRLKLAGYRWGGSENCHMGDSGPEGAHVGWTHSSGHHRNLLASGHLEMASGVAGFCWTQNFGGGTEFEREL